jgi:outer membrane immunogenic protein
MHRLLAASVAAVGLVVSLGTLASAADMPVYLKAPPPVYNWTGFYIGGNVGYSWGNSSSTLGLSDATTGAGLSSTNTNFALDGIIGGGQIGYNYQIKNWVIGLEADIQASGEKGNENSACSGALCAFTTPACPPAPGCFAPTPAIPGGAVSDAFSEKLNWFGTVRGRIGPTITPTILPYVTGGLAYGEVSAADTVSGVNSPSLTPVTATFSNSTIKAGWTVGAGLEAALGGRWTGKVEYLYVDLGNVSGAFVTPILAPSGNFLAASYSSHITDNILRVGVNYRFY